MGDTLHMSESSKYSESPSTNANRKETKRCLVASATNIVWTKTFNYLVSLKPTQLRRSPGQMVNFLLKVAALEMVRRFSRARCQIVWHGLQALQILSYPPFKWIQRFSPFKNLVRGMQTLSKPLLFLSIATAFSDQSNHYKETSENMDDSKPCSELLDNQFIPDTRICDATPEDSVSENWLLQLQEELEKQGISLPDRINEEEFHRFYTAANGDFTSLLSSIKRTIRWRETYHILSAQELEMWSHLVFWHGYDLKLRPCLIIRLGLACSSLESHDRPRFAQAVVSQVEHGVLHLVNVEDPQITVLMDCEGVSSFRFPMQIMRSCSSLVQDHYPNRLGSLFVIRLPPVLQVIAQTFIQVLKPVTQQKLRFEGEMYQKVLSEYLQTVPLFLGGQCTCAKCTTLNIGNSQQHTAEINRTDSHRIIADSDSSGDDYLNDLPMYGNCDKVLRTAILGILVLWVFIALIAGFHDPDNFPFWAS